MSIADLATKTTALQTFIHLVKGYLAPAVSRFLGPCRKSGLYVVPVALQ